MDDGDLGSVAVAGSYFLAQIAANLFAAIPFGLIVARRFAGIDIREHGSGNIGATNVGRVLGFKFFLLVFLLDFCKGAAPVAAALWLRAKFANPEPPIWILPPDVFQFLPEAVGLAAILGHMFPIYLNFKGGKGVATSLGVITLLAPIPAAIALATWLAVVGIFRIVSLASMTAACAFVAGHLATCPEPFRLRNSALTGFVFLAALLIVVRHIPNIKRLLAGTESRIQFGRKSAEQTKA